MHAKYSAARGHTALRLRHVVLFLSVLCLAPLLAGCFVNTEKPEFAVDIPEHYRFAGPGSDANLPALDWWRGFRSPELTQVGGGGPAPNPRHGGRGRAKKEARCEGTNPGRPVVAKHKRLGNRGE